MKNQKYSGQFRVRLPRNLHAWLAKEAQREGISMNTYILTLLENARGRVEYDRQRTLDQLGINIRGEDF